MIFAIIGKTSSGKSTICDMLSECGYEKIVPYTTRPKRNNEKDGVEYYFVSSEQFEKSAKNGKFAEYRTYHTTEGEWKYATAKEDYDFNKDKIVILTPQAVENIKKIFDEQIIVIYLYSNIHTLNERLKKRGDKREEAERRIQEDNKDFKDAIKISDFIIYNNVYNNIDDVFLKIKKFIDSKTK